jgi:murein L,D-transpeptidase YcbB/YkuD
MDVQRTSNLILKDDPNWTAERINEAMKGKQTIHILNKKNPSIYWPSQPGLMIWRINFYNDLYQRDDFADLLFLLIQNKTASTC